MRLISTFLATEFFVISVISANMVASRAGLGGVSWIDIDHCNSCLMGFIFYEGLELTKSPTAMSYRKSLGTLVCFLIPVRSSIPIAETPLWAYQGFPFRNTGGRSWI